ncbi:lipoprotein [Spiroplasma melliferum]|uniref:lipoprotein n=1 Tax=Spiroplasma melliferum TaxID=2134 RepID=UPI000C77622D|nr:lipoprotein [Spiroplasma melliferum]
MKKLFSIFSAMTLIGATNPNVISCNNQNTGELEEDTSTTDLEMVNELKTSASSEISNYVKSRMYVDSNKNNLAGLYEKVDSEEINYKLDLKNSKDKALANYFINDFNTIFERVNHNLSSTYMNYFNNKSPLTFEKDKSKVEVNFINVEGLKNKFPVEINTESFKGVRVNLKAVVSTEYKKIFSSFEISVVYNVTENPSVLKELSSKATKSLLQKLKEYFHNLENVDFSTSDIFKTLYEEVQWDFSENIKVLDDTLKKSLKKFTSNDDKFKDMDISYNNVALLEKTSTGELTNNNKGIDNLMDTQNAQEIALSNWFKEPNEPKSINNVTANDFVNFYKTNVGQGLNINDNDSLNLGNFKIHLGYLNINGIGLSGYAKNIEDDNAGEDVIMTLNLSRAAIDQKLNNWGEIIIAFWKYINTGPFARKEGLEITVPKDLFRNLSEKNKKEGLKGVIKTLVTNFKKSNEAKDLQDLTLFNFIAHPRFAKTMGQKNDNNSDSSFLIWNSLNSDPWAVLFTFGLNFEHGLYYCFASSSNNKMPNSSIYFKIGIKKIIY